MSVSNYFLYHKLNVRIHFYYGDLLLGESDPQGHGCLERPVHQAVRGGWQDHDLHEGGRLRSGRRSEDHFAMPMIAQCKIN